MRITRLHIVNFRSISDVVIDFGILSSTNNTHYLIGENNAGKSNICTAIRKFYDVRGKDFLSDLPFDIKETDSSYVDVTFRVSDVEHSNLHAKFKMIQDSGKGEFTIRRYLRTEGGRKSGAYYFLVTTRKQNEWKIASKKNIPDNIVEQMIGTISYIPALTSPGDQVKTSGESPLRSLLLGVLKDKSFSESLDKIRDGLEGFKRAVERSCEKTGDFLKEVNNRLARDWGIGMRLDLQELNEERLLKTQMQVVFHEVDQYSRGGTHPLETYGSGFQRSVANALIDVWASRKQPKGDEGRGSDFKILIYEEPEAFLHPAQQNILADTLSKLGAQDNYQVLLTTHSPHFVVHAMNNLKNMIYVSRRTGKTEVRKFRGDFDKELIELDNEFNENISGTGQSRGVSRTKMGVRMSAPKGYGIADHNVIRQGMQPYFIHNWFTVEDASIFFARKVLLVEGLTEKNLFSYLMCEDYTDTNGKSSSLGKSLLSEKIGIVATDGKFNMPWYVAILKEFDIPFAVLIDNDLEKYEDESKKAKRGTVIRNDDVSDEWGKRKHAHQVFNAWLEKTAKGKIVRSDRELETYLGISKGKHKSLNILKKLLKKHVEADKLNALLNEVLTALEVVSSQRTRV